MFAVFGQLADLVTIRLLGLDVGTPLGDSVHFFVEDVVKIFVLLAHGDLSGRVGAFPPSRLSVPVP